MIIGYSHFIGMSWNERYHNHLSSHKFVKVRINSNSKHGSLNKWKSIKIRKANQHHPAAFSFGDSDPVTCFIPVDMTAIRPERAFILIEYNAFALLHWALDLLSKIVECTEFDERCFAS